MEAIRATPLRAVERPASPVVVHGDRLVIDDLVIVDPSIAAFFAERPADDRAAILERAVRIGVTALQDAGVSMDVDVVRREFEGLMRRAEAVNERAASTLDEVLRQNFADGDGRLPRTLERFLGDRGQLRGFVNELFDEGKRDSALGRMRSMLGSYFDGDASRLAQLLDPTRLGSPLHQFRTEVTSGFERLNERLAAIEAAGAARASERARSSAKGADFEALVGDMLGDLCRGTGDALDRTGDETGDVIRSKQGDLLLTLDPALTHGADVRVVVECKDRAVSGKAMREELAGAKRNRAAQVGLVVFTPAHAPAGIAPFDVRLGDVYCVIDPEAPDRATLDAAVRLARLLALTSVSEHQEELDGAAIAAAMTAIRGLLDGVRALKMQLTSIGSAAREAHAGLERLREGILASVSDVERALRPTGASQPTG
jgi:hypothetical protein